MGTREKRKYIKRNCSYWGHDNKVVGKVKFDGAGVTLLQCKRCDTRTWSKGVTDSEIGDLISDTLRDIPKMDLSPEYQFPLHSFQPKQGQIKRRWWNLWKFWKPK